MNRERVSLGEMDERIRSFDWSKTPLGPAESWSPALRTTVRLIVANRLPMLLWWGPDYVSIYNDAYIPVLGAKHPWSLGLPVREVWSEIWDILRPLIDTPFHGGPATWNEDIQLEINRHGFLEETHFTIAYSPVPDEAVSSGIGGVLATVHEITEQVVGERRVVALRDLAARSLEAKTANEACRIAAATLARHDRDVPFALVYRIEAGGTVARLAGHAGIEAGTDIGPRTVDLTARGSEGWPLARVARSGAMEVVDDLATRFSAVPSGPWSDPPSCAVVLPMPASKAQEPAALLVVGLSARSRWDESYRGFLELLGAQVGTAIANARAYEEEKQRAEALAELDRAKTVFFSNVSHELRTPLTLILGPVEEMLAAAEDPAERERLDLIRRNALRLRKLVNTLLDFSRIEAGRMRASYEPVDLAKIVAECVGAFRSAFESAGLRLILDCPPVSGVVADRDMLEKVVLNLVSNAFKFTLEGEIEVSLREADGAVELSVRDTGAGIAEEHLPHVFDRFHRIEGVPARTHEGTGIGLALVQELVKLHGGTIRVESEPGRGSTFTVTIPKGTAHLPADRIKSGGDRAPRAGEVEHYVEEASRWLPGAPAVASPAGGDARPRIVWADDNADMREYVGRLLEPHYEVTFAADGEAALAAARSRAHDLVLADVMMPRLDGFGLLRALRSEERTRTIPVILLSARAGEDQRVEGLQFGADDYIVKPFSARELLARVQAHLEMARLRRDADRRKDEFLATLAHELRNPLAPIRNSLHILKLSGSDPDAVQRVREMMERQVGHMIRLVDDLMEVSRITRGKVELRREPVHLAAIVRNAVEISTPMIEAGKHKLTVSLPPEPLLLEADPVRLAQALANLLNNAAKYTDSGGRIWLTVTRDGASAVLSVRDDGIGIAPELLPRIFELFAQASDRYERSQGGLGIGLTLVRSLVEMHGGRVEARSEGPGRGSEFVVVLPLAGASSLSG